DREHGTGPVDPLRRQELQDAAQLIERLCRLAGWCEDRGSVAKNLSQPITARLRHVLVRYPRERAAGGPELGDIGHQTLGRVPAKMNRIAARPEVDGEAFGHPAG